jgi:hypothetical protein
MEASDQLAPLEAAVAEGRDASDFGCPANCPPLEECAAKVVELRAALGAAAAVGPQDLVDTVSMTDDYMLLRYLIARDFDVAAAKEMFDLRAAFAAETQLSERLAAWRCALAHPDAAAPARVALQRRVFYAGQSATDGRDGAPVFVERMGQADFGGCSAEGEPMLGLVADAYAIYDELILRAVQRASFEQCKLVRATLIVDNGGMGMSALWNASIIKRVASVGLAYFPELTGKIFIIRAPWFISSIWALVRPLLPERTLEKIDILGAEYAETLAEAVDIGGLPGFLGGTTESVAVCAAQKVDDECRALLREAMADEEARVAAACG